MIIKSWLIKLSCVSVVPALYISNFNLVSTAQIIPDGSLPINSVIENGANNTKIINGGTTSGSNLFHSFDQFTIPTSSTAYFNNAVGIQNIFSRITGNSISNIDGTLRTNGNANLFLLNHNGIVFGPNASLNIGGSFLATTSGAITFSDGTQFSTKIDRNAPLLTVSVPVGLNLDSSSGIIHVQNSGHNLVSQNFIPINSTNQPIGLGVKPGKNIYLVGGDVVMEGGIVSAPSGRIEIGSVNTGIVNLNWNNSSWVLDYTQISDFKNLGLFTRSLINASGFGGGSIQLQASNISLTEGSVIFIQNQGLLNSGKIGLNATDSIQISGTDPIARIPGGISTITLTSGSSANIVILSPKLVVTEGGLINTTTYSTGKAGNINVKAPDSIQLIGSSPRSARTVSNITSFTFNQGNAGDVSVQTGDFIATNGGLLFSISLGSGLGGDIKVDATKSVQLIGVQPTTLVASSISSSATRSGDAGSVNINTAKLLVENGGRVDSSTLASGSAGSIAINASDSVEVKGTVPGSRNPSLIISSANILDNVLLESLGSVDPLILTGNSGDINITTNKLTVIDGGLISVSNEGLGNAGDIKVFSDFIFLNNEGGINAATLSGEGGKIFVQTENLQLNNSEITSTAGNQGNGGNIDIKTDTLVALDNSTITAKAAEGTGGNIQITTQGLFLSPDSFINASSSRGIDGTVDIQTLEFDEKNSLTPLDNNFVDPDQILAGSCLTRRNEQSGSFVVTGTGGLPDNPYSANQAYESLTRNKNPQGVSTTLQTSPPIIEASPIWKPGDPIIDANSLVRTNDGQVMLVAQKPNLQDTAHLTCQKEEPKENKQIYKK